MNLIITPVLGVGPIRFGMSKKDVQTVLKCGFREFRKTSFAETTTDDLFSLHLHVYYDNEARVKDVEIFDGAAPVLNGQLILGRPFRSVADELTRHDGDIVYTETGLRSNLFGLAVYSPDASENRDALVEAVYIFMKD